MHEANATVGLSTVMKLNEALLAIRKIWKDEDVIFPTRTRPNTH